MKLGSAIVKFSTDRPRLVTGLMLAAALGLGILVALPSLWPDTFSMLWPVEVDTDPENMLNRHEAVRVFHNEMKQLLALHDMVVLGVVNEIDPNGVFNPASLRNIYDLTEYAKTLRGGTIGAKDPQAGVIEVDIIAPSTVDNIEQGGPGVVRFEWLMPKPPETEAAALAVRDKAQRIPFLEGTLVSEDGKALCIYLPLTAKDLSYKVATKLQGKIKTLSGDDRYFITGLPVAEDTFGVKMFEQMAISAPLAMLIIFLLMWVFFRKFILIVSPMIVALASVIITMGLLVVTGNTIHIMSSMIPIFIMPISVLDSIHILSEFFERYQATKDRRKTITSVMDTLFVPMLYTSLTSAAGFASLALTPIPPVQVFGLFVAIGVMVAWVLTITFIPAFVMFVRQESLNNFGVVHTQSDSDDVDAKTRVGRFLLRISEATYHRAKLVLVVSAVAAVVAVYGMTRIQINDNPIRWFEKSHPIRVADRVLNEHFGGTYMAYLALRPEGEDTAARSREPGSGTPQAPDAGAPSLPAGLGTEAPGLPEGLSGEAEAPELPAGLLEDGTVETVAETDTGPPGAKETPAAPAEEIFKNPETLRYIEALQAHLAKSNVVGKSNSLADIVKTVHRELRDGTDAQFRIPDTVPAVAQCLMQYQSSHRPGDLWHFVTPDYRLSSIWVQLKSGDNRDMEKVLESVDRFVASNPPPSGLKPEWFGLTYINVVWQNRMVTGMFQSFLGSFLVVLLMMIILFRSGLWGILSMIPLTITIGLIYGVIGLIGKDYDMPVAVLSSLTLGMAVDFAIHFLVRSRDLYAQFGDWRKAHAHVFGEPARAITRNVIVIAVGFLPLLAAPLVPYQTVGVFLAAILFVSGAGTLLILPALIRVLEPLMFPKTKICSVTCQCGTCILSAVTAVLVVVVNVHQFLAVGWTKLTWFSLVAIPILGALCAIMSHREKCRAARETECKGG